jgi:hypothetical protein
MYIYVYFYTTIHDTQMKGKTGVRKVQCPSLARSQTLSRDLSCVFVHTLSLTHSHTHYVYTYRYIHTHTHTHIYF